MDYPAGMVFANSKINEIKNRYISNFQNLGFKYFDGYLFFGIKEKL